MTRLLITTALAGLLAAGTAAHAQDRHDDHRPGGGGAPHAAPSAAPPHEDHHMQGPRPASPGGPAAPAAAMRHDDHGGPRPSNAMAGPRPAAPRSPNVTAAPRPGPAMARPNSHPDYSSYHRAFNAPRQFHAPAYHRPSGWYAHRWTYGEFLPQPFWARDYWLMDFGDYGLMPPPPGTVWVQYGNDALLIDEYSGEVIQVEYGVFY